MSLVAALSIATAVTDAFFGALAVSGAVDIDDVDEEFVKYMAALVVVLLLTTALPPVLRRLQSRHGEGSYQGAVRPAATPASPEEAPSATLASQVAASAARIESLNADPGNRAPEIRRECQRLRELARSFGGEAGR